MHVYVGARMSVTLNSSSAQRQLHHWRLNLAGCHLSRCMKFSNILSKHGTLVYNNTPRLNLTQTKIRMYVLDSLDTILKKYEADIAVCQEKQIKGAKISKGLQVIVDQHQGELQPCNNK